MPSTHVTRRQRATRSHRHIVVSVYYTRDDSMAGLHLCATRHTRTHCDIATVDALGNTRVYAPSLQPITVTQTLTLDTQSLDLEFAWPHPQIDPRGIYWIGCRVEVSSVYEDSDGMESHELRDALLVGRVTSADLDAVDTMMRLGVESASNDDQGDFYSPDAELSAVRFTDINNGIDSDKRNRAYQSMRLLPPIPFCRNGGALESPMSVVVDEVPADGVAALVPRRYLVSYAPLAAEDSLRNVMLLKPDRQPEYYVPSSLIQCAVSVGIDSIGDPYRYIGDGVTLSVGNVSTNTFTNGVDVVLMSRKQGMVHEGDCVKAIIDSGIHYGVVDSIDGSDVTLEAAYTGTSGSGAADVIKLPADTQYPAYLLVGQSGGGVCVNDSPVSTAVDVAAYALGYSRIDGRVLLQEVRGLTRATMTLDVEVCINKRQSPLSWLNDTLLQWVPFRVYRDGVYLRCYDRIVWHSMTHPALTVSDGAVGAECVRSSEYATVGEYAKPRVMRYAWSNRLGRSTRVLNLQGAGALETRLRRMVRLTQLRRVEENVPYGTEDPVETHEIAEIADYDVACVAQAMHLVTDGTPTYQTTLELTPSLWWLRCGDTLTLDDSQVPSVADGSRVWRVERMERGATDVAVVREVAV